MQFSMFGLDFIEAFITQTERNLFMKNFIFEMHYNKSLDKRQDDRKSFLHWLGQDSIVLFPATLLAYLP